MAIDIKTKEIIIEMWDKGLSGGVIAKETGLTRNSILGFIHRMRENGHIFSRKPIVKRQKKLKTTFNKDFFAHKEKVAVAKKEKVMPPKKQHEPPELYSTTISEDYINKSFTKPEYGVSMIDLKYSSCRFIITNDTSNPPIYCGSEIQRGAYCKFHADLCYVKPRHHLKYLTQEK